MGGDHAELEVTRQGRRPVQGGGDAIQHLVPGPMALFQQARLVEAKEEFKKPTTVRKHRATLSESVLRKAGRRAGRLADNFPRKPTPAPRHRARPREAESVSVIGAEDVSAFGRMGVCRGHGRFADADTSLGGDETEIRAGSVSLSGPVARRCVQSSPCVISTSRSKVHKNSPPYRPRIRDQNCTG
jgi:hypothetical protein